MYNITFLYKLLIIVYNIKNTRNVSSEHQLNLSGEGQLDQY